MKCYVCKECNNVENDPDSIVDCQDCGRQYHLKCFYTPCHDLCADDIGGYHFIHVDCPHRIVT